MTGELPDVNSPEFKEVIYKMAFEMLESAKWIKSFAEKVESINFQDLTSETWAMVVAGQPAIKAMAEYQVQSVMNSGVFIEDPEMMQKVHDYAIEETKRKREEGL